MTTRTRRTGLSRLRVAPGRADEGAAAVEFALVVPLLLLVIFGMINFGILFSQQLSLNNAVREGARRAVVGDPASPRTCDQIISSVQNQLSALALTATSVEVKVTQQGWSDGNGCGSTFQSSSFGAAAAKVPCKGSFASSGSLIVEARYVSTIPVAFPPFPTTLTLTSKAVFRCEFSS